MNLTNMNELRKKMKKKIIAKTNFSNKKKEQKEY